MDKVWEWSRGCSNQAFWRPTWTRPVGFMTHGGRYVCFDTPDDLDHHDIPITISPSTEVFVFPTPWVARATDNERAWLDNTRPWGWPWYLWFGKSARQCWWEGLFKYVKQKIMIFCAEILGKTNLDKWVHGLWSTCCGLWKYNLNFWCLLWAICIVSRKTLYNYALLCNMLTWMSLVYAAIANFFDGAISNASLMTKALTDHLVEANFQLSRSHVRNL